MARFRYRTATLVGAWRATRAQAEADAMAAGQARRDADGTLIWRLPGEIETDGEIGPGR